MTVSLIGNGARKVGIDPLLRDIPIVQPGPCPGRERRISSRVEHLRERPPPDDVSIARPTPPPTPPPPTTFPSLARPPSSRIRAMGRAVTRVVPEHAEIHTARRTSRAPAARTRFREG